VYRSKKNKNKKIKNDKSIYREPAATFADGEVGLSPSLSLQWKGRRASKQDALIRRLSPLTNSRKIEKQH
jgi:hypothetical protein